MSTDKLPPLPEPVIHAPFLKEIRSIPQGRYYTSEQITAYGLASRADLVRLITAVHKAKGRYHSQVAMSALYDACGLPNEKPIKDLK